MSFELEEVVNDQANDISKAPEALLIDQTYGDHNGGGRSDIDD